MRKRGMAKALVMKGPLCLKPACQHTQGGPMLPCLPKGLLAACPPVLFDFGLFCSAVLCSVLSCPSEGVTFLGVRWAPVVHDTLLAGDDDDEEEDGAAADEEAARGGPDPHPLRC
jgi:hypothetical protein